MHFNALFVLKNITFDIVISILVIKRVYDKNYQ